MPRLEWIGKDKVVNHHMDVPFHVLEHKYGFDESGMHEERMDSGNMIIHGDNLVALKSLLPQFEGKIKCIYIDPPYNTGNEKWCYNDNVNDPRIKKWLGQVVGKEGEDLSRHDKWLCMMYPRLRLLGQLLHINGVLIASLSHHELSSYIKLCEEIFATKQIVTVTVQTSGGKPSSGFNYVHEYLVFITPKDFSPNAMDFCGGNERTPYEGLTLSTFNKVQRPNQVYPIFVEKNTGAFVGIGRSLQQLIDAGEYVGNKEDFIYSCSDVPQNCVPVWPITIKGKPCVWRHIPERFISDWNKGYIKISRNKRKNAPNVFSIQYLPSGVIKKIEMGILKVIGHETNAPTLIFGKNETVGGQIPTIWLDRNFYTVKGTQSLEAHFPENGKVFDYPKPVDLLINIFQATSGDNDIILTRGNN